MVIVTFILIITRGTEVTHLFLQEVLVDALLGGAGTARLLLRRAQVKTGLTFRDQKRFWIVIDNS